MYTGYSTGSLILDTTTVLDSPQVLRLFENELRTFLVFLKCLSSLLYSGSVLVSDSNTPYSYIRFTRSSLSKYLSFLFTQIPLSSSIWVSFRLYKSFRLSVFTVSYSNFGGWKDNFRNDEGHLVDLRPTRSSSDIPP